MPIVFRHEGARFHFFSDEGSPREPQHVHVKKGDQEAKIWLRPEIAVAESFGFNAMELNALMRLVRRERSRIERAWNEHFGHGG